MSEAEQAFQTLKKALTSSPVLHSPDFSCPFVLYTNATGTGLEAVLSQTKDGQEHPIVMALLHWMSKAKDTNARVTRWFLALQDFHIQVQHRAGVDHRNTDGLSRSWSQASCPSHRHLAAQTTLGHHCTTSRLHCTLAFV